MDKWRLPTLHDANNEALTTRYRDGVSNPVQNAPSVIVRCDCGRQVPSDMMVDLRVLPANRNLPEFVCDGCMSVLISTHTVSLSDLATAHGAPFEDSARLGQYQQDRFKGHARASKLVGHIRRNRPRSSPQEGR